MLPNADCQIEVQFQHTREGRPEIYDFFWEHVPQLFQLLKEKKVEMCFSPEKKGKTKKENTMLMHFTQKFLEEKRFKYKIEKTKNEIRTGVPIHELENVLSAYNILLEACLPTIQFNSPKIEIDYSNAEENRVIIRTNQKQVPRIHAFLKKNTRKPGIRTILFANPKLMQRMLQPKKKNR